MTTKRGTAKPVGPAIAPAIISRTPVFQPRFKNLVQNVIVGDTPWGHVQVTGKLGGIHRKILDAIFASAVRSKSVEGGSCLVIVDLYRVSKLAQVASSPKWILGQIRDMMDATVEITDHHTGLKHVGHIISEYRESPHRVPLPAGHLKGVEATDRPYYVITVSAAWMRVYDTSLVVRYRDLLPVLGRLKSGVTHALALHTITHQAHTVALDDVLRHVGAWTEGTSERHQRRIREQVLSEAETLSQIGISFYCQAESGEWMIAYHPPRSVHFQKPSP